MSKLSQLDRSIQAKTALVTGAASGIGRAIVHLLVDEGAKVGLVDINEQGLQTLAKEIHSVGGEAFCVLADCGDRAALQTAVVDIAEHFGALDIVVNNAGLVLGSDINDPDQFEVSWQRSIDVMASAQQWSILAALPYLTKAEHPRIVNIASSEALGATAYNSAYVAAKHASLGLTRAMAVDLGKQGITVNCVCPGPVRTALTALIPEEDKTVYARRRTALRRYAEPEEIAYAVLSLLAPSASFITGAAIPVDGGLTIRNA